MMKFYRRKIASGMKTVRFPKVDDSLLWLFLFFLFGLFFGSMASSKFFVDLILPGGTGKIVLDSISLALLLFFSTSFLGVVFIPLLVCARAFAFSALFSSVCFFSSAGGLVNAIFAEVVPALFFLPCFYLLADDCMSLSSVLFRCRCFHQNWERSHIFRHLLLSFPLLAFEILYCLYLFPLLLS